MRDVASLTLRIPKSLHKKAKEIGKLENKSLNEIIRELLKNWLKKGEKKCFMMHLAKFMKMM
jgi:Glu-tRNA(Gln) amidotransferase subunit E-like FAD-binding protein